MAFYAGSKVTMADGSKKSIESISYGEYVKDFRGQPALVDGVRVRSNFIQNPVREKCLINDKFLVTDGTTFISPQYNFYVSGSNPLSVSSTFTMGKKTAHFIGEKNRIRDLWLWFDDSYRSKFSVLSVGHIIVKEDGNNEQINTIRQLQDSEVDPSLDVMYALSTKSGTMWVDGYLVISRLNEDFDYSTMTPITEPFEITWNHVTNEYSRVINIDYSTNKNGIWDKKNDCWLNSWMKK
jgi:hypothetical protein